MTEKEEFENLMFDVGTYLPESIPNDQIEIIWSYFQSKQQEKIERVKRLREDFYPKDRFSDGYQIAISDVLKIMEKNDRERIYD